MARKIKMRAPTEKKKVSLWEDQRFIDGLIDIGVALSMMTDDEFGKLSDAMVKRAKVRKIALNAEAWVR